MSYKDYNITIPYTEFIKLKDMEKQYNDLKTHIKDCFIVKENGIIEVDITKLKNIGKEFLPLRFLDYSFNEVR